MRTTLNLDDGVMRDLLHATHADTKTQAVTEAVKDYVRRKQLEALRGLQGKLQLASAWRRLERAEIRSLKRSARRQHG